MIYIEIDLSCASPWLLWNEVRILLHINIPFFLFMQFEEIKKCQCSKYFFPSEDKVSDYCIRLVQSSESEQVLNEPKGHRSLWGVIPLQSV